MGCGNVPIQRSLRGKVRRDSTEKILRVNERIRAPQVRVIDHSGEQLGIMSVRQALEIAKQRAMDLIEIAPTAQPPVCKIVDYGKFRYEQRKRQKEARKKTAAAEMKSIRIHPDTAPHDLVRFRDLADKFLREGHKVRITCLFRGRERTHPELGRDRLLKIAEELREIAHVEAQPDMQGRQMNMTIAPSAATLRKAHDEKLRQRREGVQPEPDKTSVLEAAREPEETPAGAA